jgi:hypothetical protein
MLAFGHACIAAAAADEWIEANCVTDLEIVDRVADRDDGARAVPAGNARSRACRGGSIRKRKVSMVDRRGAYFNDDIAGRFERWIARFLLAQYVGAAASVNLYGFQGDRSSAGECVRLFRATSDGALAVRRPAALNEFEASRRRKTCRNRRWRWRWGC